MLWARNCGCFMSVKRLINLKRLRKHPSCLTQGFRLTQARASLLIKCFALHSNSIKSWSQNFWKNWERAVGSMASVQKDRIYGKHKSMSTKCTAAKAMQVMITRALKLLFIHMEWSLWGSRGSVCANWMQYNLIKNTWKSWQTKLTIGWIGSPLGLFKSKPEATH